MQKGTLNTRYFVAGTKDCTKKKVYIPDHKPYFVHVLELYLLHMQIQQRMSLQKLQKQRSLQSTT